jgi:predicted patatin/cPLA2 family phospholipase
VVFNASGFKADLVAGELAYCIEHGRFREGTRVAVLFEGGALRGVVSCGFGLALSELIRPRTVPLLLGCSSGALNAVYFACGMSNVALDIYAENATDSRCTNIWNFPDILNVDWLLDEWLFQKRAFNYEAIRDSDADIFVVLTNLNTGEPRYVNLRGSDREMMRAVLKATAYSPLLSTGRQVIDGQPYGDGLVADAIPYDKAVLEGATHVICLLTRPADYRKQDGALIRAFEKLRLMGHQTDYLAKYFKRQVRYNALMDRLYMTHERLVPTLIIHPANSSEIPGSIGTNAEVIRKFERLSYNNARATFAALVPDRVAIRAH